MLRTLPYRVTPVTIVKPASILVFLVAAAAPWRTPQAFLSLDGGVDQMVGRDAIRVTPMSGCA